MLNSCRAIRVTLRRGLRAREPRIPPGLDLPPVFCGDGRLGPAKEARGQQHPTRRF